MRRIVLPVLGVLVVFAGAYLAHRGYGLYQQRQKRRELFVYLQKKSPITRRMPADASLYVNLFDFRRVYSGIQDTPAYAILTHWLDTGMSDEQKANPILGGMLEKTIMNVIGDEVGVAMVPARHKHMELLVVAKIAAGSDFLLKLMLAGNHKIRKVAHGEDVVYSLSTRNLQYPEVLILVDDQYAYASTSMDRMMAARQEGPGPAFLRSLPVEAIPENTFLLLESASPRCSLLVSGHGRDYRISSSCDSRSLGNLPDVHPLGDTVLSFQTNGAELANQPVVGFFVRAEGRRTSSSLLLNFNSSAAAYNARQLVLSDVDAVPDETVDGSTCAALSRNQDSFLCANGTALLFISGEAEPKKSVQYLQKPAPGKRPLIVQLRFHPEPLSGYLQRVANRDWSDYPQAGLLYLLSSVKEVRGGIGPSGDSIEVELQ